jgi:hypothetical protein
MEQYSSWTKESDFDFEGDAALYQSDVEADLKSNDDVTFESLLTASENQVDDSAHVEEDEEVKEMVDLQKQMLLKSTTDDKFNLDDPIY